LVLLSVDSALLVEAPPPVVEVVLVLPPPELLLSVSVFPPQAVPARLVPRANKAARLMRPERAWRTRV
jgi:hypothetical protein